MKFWLVMTGYAALAVAALVSGCVEESDLGTQSNPILAEQGNWEVVRIEYVKLETGLECIRMWNRGVAVSCNWDKWNREQN